LHATAIDGLELFNQLDNLEKAELKVAQAKKDRCGQTVVDGITERAGFMKLFVRQLQKEI
jgi:hypothetical protein